MDEEDKWAIELERNLELLFWNGGNDAKNLVVNGSGVRKDHKKVIVIGDNDTEIFDCETEHILEGPSMIFMRMGAAVSNLPSGDVAVFGGYGNDVNREPRSVCELFKANDFWFSFMGSTPCPRNHAPSRGADRPSEAPWLP